MQVCGAGRTPLKNLHFLHVRVSQKGQPLPPPCCNKWTQHIGQLVSEDLRGRSTPMCLAAGSTYTFSWTGFAKSFPVVCCLPGNKLLIGNSLASLIFPNVIQICRHKSIYLLYCVFPVNWSLCPKFKNWLFKEGIFSLSRF